MERAEFQTAAGGRVPGSVLSPIPHPGPAETVQLFPLINPSIAASPFPSHGRSLNSFKYILFSIISIFL
jgi:hypothetical protein